MVLGFEQETDYADYDETMDEFDVLFAISILVSVFVFALISLQS
ncbi:hypothetical protein GAH_00351 [Geoglobus ahangari]|uniref:Uncharacterized protein n=1 Tax=Geoglobus ahangari TaxID=113653 RepID=A0A0F7DC64_9EURY|nr:hypothetical protein [Geoglobus ahangari]AKG92296.1 hypothetical protein GAH_00351 [Geoglobus ahangari]